MKMKIIIIFNVLFFLKAALAGVNCTSQDDRSTHSDSFFSEFLKELHLLNSFSESDLTSFSEIMFEKYSQAKRPSHESARKKFLTCIQSDINTTGCHSDWIQFSSVLLNFKSEIENLAKCINTDDSASKQSASYLKSALPKIVQIQEQIWRNSFSSVLTLSLKEVTTKHEFEFASSIDKTSEEKQFCGLLKDKLNMELNGIIMDTFLGSPLQQDTDLLLILNNQKDELINGFSCK